MSSGERGVVGSPARHPRSRIVRLALFVTIILFGIATVWFTIGVSRARRQREAIAAITQAGGLVHYAYEWNSDSFVDHSPLDAEPRPWVPEFLRRILGDDFFYDVADVYLRAGDDAAVAKLRIWRHLKGLYINQFAITDRGMEYVGEFPELEVLWLGGSPEITPKGFTCLKRLSRLRDLSIEGCPISDADLANLSGATELGSLTLVETHANGLGLAHLKARDLRLLALDGSPVTDAGLSGIKALPGITWLTLNRTRVTDEGLVWLEKLNLYHLELDQTRVTGTGLRYLRGSKKSLEALCLEGAPVTDEGLAAIGEFSHLSDLFLGSNKITDAGLPSLYRLDRININMFFLEDNNDVSESAVRELYRHLGFDYETVH